MRKLYTAIGASILLMTFIGISNYESDSNFLTRVDDHENKYPKHGED